jgi:hypothetical protein
MVFLSQQAPMDCQCCRQVLTVFLCRQVLMDYQSFLQAPTVFQRFQQA